MADTGVLRGAQRPQVLWQYTCPNAKEACLTVSWMGRKANPLDRPNVWFPDGQNVQRAGTENPVKLPLPHYPAEGAGVW